MASDESWRQGHKVPQNVYAGDRPVAQFHDAETAALVVQAVNERTANAAFEGAAHAAVAYIAAHAALVAAGTSSTRPAAAHQLAVAWIALTRACAQVPETAAVPASGVASGVEAAAVPGPSMPVLGHGFEPAPFYPDRCNVKVDEDGRARTCARPRREH